MGQVKRAAAKLPLARFQGERWTVAMCEPDWSKFCGGITTDACLRLTAVLESFCADGEADLPPGCFHWFARGQDDPAGVDQGAFEARGVVLIGRRAVIDGKETFFVTKVVDDSTPPAHTRRKPRQLDQRQRQLPFQYRKPRGDQR